MAASYTTLILAQAGKVLWPGLDAINISCQTSLRFTAHVCNMEPQLVYRTLHLCALLCTTCTAMGMQSFYDKLRFLRSVFQVKIRQDRSIILPLPGCFTDSHYLA